MSTKAQDFKAEHLKTIPPRKPQPKKVRANVGTKRARGAADGTSHEHTGAKGASKATVVLEESLSGAPSRKTTRASANKQKGASVKEHAVQVKSTQPSARRGRRGG